MGYCSCGNWVDEGSICSHCGSALTYDEPDEDDENEYNPFHGRYEYFIRQGKTCSIKGDHKTAIKFYEEAMNYGGQICFRIYCNGRLFCRIAVLE